MLTPLPAKTALNSLSPGTVKCWGSGATGQLGKGSTSNLGDGSNEMGDDLTTIDLGTNRTARTLTSGSGHICALLDDGTVKCWGANLNGQLGRGSIGHVGDAGSEMGANLIAVNLGTNRSARVVVASNYHTCAILDNGTVKCWGYNAYGELGLGDTSHRGDEANEMGDNLPVVNLGTNRTARSLALGENYSCALLDNGTVKCWGLNINGQLGLEDTANRGDGANEMGDNLPAINLGTNRTVRSLVASGFSYGNCAILDNGTTKCWGRNSYGQLGLGTAFGNVGDAANEMGDNLSVMDFGTNRSARSLAVGPEHGCAILDNGSLKCWGHNDRGQLGIGDTGNRGDAANEMGNRLRPIRLGR